MKIVPVLKSKSVPRLSAAAFLIAVSLFLTNGVNAQKSAGSRNRTAVSPVASQQEMATERVQTKSNPELESDKTEQFNSLAPEAVTASAYPFTTLSGVALEDMSTGTTQIVAPGVDDTASAVTNTGFDFWFDGVRYTQFSCNANGVCRLGAVAIGTTFTNSLASTTDSPKIAPYFDDLSTGSNGKIHYKVVGSAPNRKLVVEFSNMNVPRAGGAGTFVAAPGAATFQLWLFESAATTNPGVIQFVYGNGIVANTVNSGYSVGIQSGAATNFASVTTSTNTVDYATANNTQTNAIAAGTSYLFTPNIPTAPTGLTFTATNAFSTTLNFTDNASNEVGYAIYRSTDGGVTYIFSAQTAANATSYTDTGLSPNTTYFYRVYAVTEGALSNPALSGSTTTAAPGNDTCAGAGGNYSDPTVWADGTVPTAADNVTITAGCTVTVDTAGAVGLNVTIDNGGTLQSPTTGAVTTNLLTVGGSLTNNGTFDFSTNGNTSGAGITFIGATNNTFGGTGAITDVRTITINKGTTNANVLELTAANFTVQGVATDVAGFLTLTNGTFKLSGTFTVTNRVFTVAGYTIGATTGFWLNNPNFTVAGQAGSGTVSGLFRMTQGTFNIGTATGNSLGFSAGANVIVEGGAINSTGRFGVATAANTFTYNQSAGTITTCTIGNASTTLACFDLGTSATSPVTISGGTIVVRVASTAASGPRDYRHQAGATGITTVTGGTLQLGDASSPAAVQAYDIAGVVPNFVLTNTTAAHTATFLAPAGFNNITLNITTAAGTTLSAGANILLFNGTLITNNGAITSTSTFTIFGAAPALYTGTGTTTVAALANQSGSSFTVDPASPNIVATAVRLFTGNYINSYKITVGAGGATAATIQIGNTTTPTAAGTFDSSPTFNPGTGGITVSYLRTTASRTTGGEIPATRTITSLTYDDNDTTHSLTIAGGDLTVTGALALTNGIVLTGTNTLVHNGAATRTTGFVAGNMSRSYTAAGTYTYFVGDNAGTAEFSPMTANITALGTNPSSLRIFVVDSTLPGVDPAQAASRYWVLTETGDLTADLSFTYVDADINGDETKYSIFKRPDTGGGDVINQCGGVACVNAATNTAGPATGVTTFSQWGVAQFDAVLVPTAANVTVSGRAMTSTGRGIRNITIKMTGTNGVVRTAKTGDNGYYQFTDVPAGETYVFNASGKRFEFTQQSQVFPVNEDLPNVNFISKD